MIPDQGGHVVKRATLSAVLALTLLWSVAAGQTQNKYAAHIAALFERDSVTIVVTDSGLGGLSVCADLEALFRESRAIRSVRLVFVNALPDLAYTYNAMRSVEEQARVFDDALRGIVAASGPDAILIACNTLSAVYPKTTFSRNAAIPVVSIIDVGSRMIADQAKRSGSSRIIILGTPSTIASGSYQEQFAALGIGQEKIVAQPCKLLESEIQADPNSDLVSSLIETYVDEAMEKIGPESTGRATVGLCCSHYGYSLDAFRLVLKQRLGEQFEIVNPNNAMVALFAVAKEPMPGQATRTTVQVLSKVPFTEQEIQSIAGAVVGKSPRTAEALKHYQQRDNLFPLRK
jgi:glutamate racemase